MLWSNLGQTLPLCPTPSLAVLPSEVTTYGFHNNPSSSTVKTCFEANNRHHISFKKTTPLYLIKASEEKHRTLRGQRDAPGLMDREPLSQHGFLGDSMGRTRNCIRKGQSGRGQRVRGQSSRACACATPESRRVTQGQSQGLHKHSMAYVHACVHTRKHQFKTPSLQGLHAASLTAQRSTDEAWGQPPLRLSAVITLQQQCPRGA